MFPSSLIRSPFEGCKTLIYFIIRNKNKLVATKFIHKSHFIEGSSNSMPSQLKKFQDTRPGLSRPPDGFFGPVWENRRYQSYLIENRN